MDFENDESIFSEVMLQIGKVSCFIFRNVNCQRNLMKNMRKNQVDQLKGEQDVEEDVEGGHGQAGGSSDQTQSGGRGCRRGHGQVGVGHDQAGVGQGSSVGTPGRGRGQGEKPIGTSR
jgi:hypothetical protein